MDSQKSFNRNQFSLQWIGIYSLTLAIYLSFFHSCLDSSYRECITYGICFWLAWVVVCWVARGAFLKRFEFVMYQLVGVDILIEGFIPDHSGYGFYWCTTAFWSVLLAYRLIPATALEKAPVSEGGDEELPGSLVAEPSN